jgi:hypothetical protein
MTTKIVCRAINCIFNEDKFCTSEEIVYDPEDGCLTYEELEDLVDIEEDEEDWDDEDLLDEDDDELLLDDDDDDDLLLDDDDLEIEDDGAWGGSYG